MPGELSGKTAIVGIGATDFSKNSGRGALRLASEAVLDALDDAGLSPADVDGMVTFTMDSNTEVAIARATGIGDLTFFSKIHHGGGAACATVQQAAIAVATGVADCVVAYRAFNERSGQRFGQVQMRLVENADSTGVDNSFSYPHGLSTPAAQVAMIAKRYMHLSGATSKDFGAVSVADRKHAANNPKAYFYEKPITIEDHQNSRWIAEPLRLLDCCQETDGGVALVIVSAERAKDLKHRPAVIDAAAQGSSPNQYSMVSYYRPELDGLPEMGLVGKQLWAQSGLKPTDIQTAILYDHFTPFTLIQLEELGFCGWGEAKDYIADGAIELGGRLPINTHGGQLGVHPRHERHRRGRAPASWHVRQPGARRGARARHGRHRSPYLRAHPRLTRRVFGHLRSWPVEARTGTSTHFISFFSKLSKLRYKTVEWYEKPCGRPQKELFSA
jgi:acetyl-CoA acetyltransferase